MDTVLNDTGVSKRTSIQPSSLPRSASQYVRKLSSNAWSGPTASSLALAQAGFPAARSGVVMVTERPIFGAGPSFFQSLPMSARRSTALSSKRPSRLGATLRIRLQWFLLNGFSQSSTMVFAEASSDVGYAFFQNQSLCSVVPDCEGTG